MPINTQFKENMEDNKNQTPPAELLAWWDESSSKQSTSPEENYKISKWDELVAWWYDPTYKPDKKPQTVAPPPIMVAPSPQIVQQPQIAPHPMPEWLSAILGLIFIVSAGFFAFFNLSILYRLLVLFW